MDTRISRPPVAAVALLALAHCAAEPPPAPRASLAPPVVVAVAPRSAAGCELIERAAPCRLEDVGGAVALDGEREVVAVYRVEGDETAPRVERRFRVEWLALGEASHIAHVRQHPKALCRWQTVVQGDACPVHPASVDIPDATAREERRARHARGRSRSRRRAT